jgi:hypothetical protein
MGSETFITAGSGFQQQASLSLSEFFHIAVNLYFRFLASAIDTPASPALLDTSAATPPVYAAEDEAKVLKILSIKADDFAVHLFGKPRQSWATDFSPLLAHPLIEVFENRYACPDLSYFRLFFPEGIFWLLDEAIGNDAWRSFFGVIFAWYVEQIIRSFAVDSEHLAKTFYHPTKFQRTEDECCDGLLLWENTVALCEYKAARLTTRSKAAVQMQETLSGIERAVGSKDAGIGQLVKSIVRICSGEPVVCGNERVEIGPTRRIIPIIIWNEEVACNNAVRGHLQKLFAAMLASRMSDLSRIGPLLLFAPRDLESFDACAQTYEAESLMRDFALFVEKFPRDPRCVFHRYAAEKFPDPRPGTAFIEAKRVATIRAIQEENDRRAPSID